MALDARAGDLGEAPEVLDIRFARKEQASLPATVLKGKSRTCLEFLAFYNDFISKTS